MRACTDDVCLFRSVRVRKRPVTFSRTAWRAGWCWPGSAWRARVLAQAAWTGPCGRPLSRWQMSGRRTLRSSRQPTTAQRHDAGSEQQQRTTVCNYVLRQWSWIVFSQTFHLVPFKLRSADPFRGSASVIFTCLRWNHGDQAALMGRPSFFSVYRVDVVGILASVSPLLITKEQDRFKPQRM